MRRTIYLIAAASALGVGWWLYSYNEQVVGMVQQYVENGEFVTLEARYTPEQIMEAHRAELLVSSQHTFGEHGLKFHPYLMMEVKYAQADKKTREGVLFWSLVDGEMVLNADTWDKTHGFEDAINANASKTDFKLINALAKYKGAATFEQLQKELRVEKDTLQMWVHNAIGKHLILQTNHGLQLHFQEPKILVQPETAISQWLVAKPYDNAQRIGRKYSNNQIQKVTTAAFGDDFKIRTMTEVFLPVYSIEVHNPDGSVRTSYWNALNGQIIQPKYLARRL